MLGHLVYNRQGLDGGAAAQPTHAGWLRRLFGWLFHH